MKDGDQFQNEIDLELHCCEHAEVRHNLGNIKVQVEGERGWPDRLFFGRVENSNFPVCFFVEFKDEGETVRRNQKRIHKRIRERGIDVYVVDTYNKFLEVLKIETRVYT